LLHLEREKAEALALMDDLTSLPNRRLGRRFLEMEVAAAQRGRQICLVIFDLDNFKIYNDRHGHPAGDRALAAMGQALIKTTRKMNMSVRWGGEEFITVLSDATAAGALVFVQRVREALLAAAVVGGPLTFSAGVAEYGPGIATADDLLQAADEALYEAKARGRNCAVVHRARSSNEAPARAG
jgi:diguanylate cyclase (GGDEF)-like protein